MVVSVCTTFFNVRKLRILPTECIYICRMILTLKSHYFLNAINWLVFVMETQCVDCEVGTKFLYIIFFSHIHTVHLDIIKVYLFTN